MDSKTNCPDCGGDCNSVLEAVKEQLQVTKYRLEVPKGTSVKFTEEVWLANEIEFDWIGDNSDERDVYEFESQYARDRASKLFLENAVISSERTYDAS